MDSLVLSLAEKKSALQDARNKLQRARNNYYDPKTMTYSSNEGYVQSLKHDYEGQESRYEAAVSLLRDTLSSEQLNRVLARVNKIVPDWR